MKELTKKELHKKLTDEFVARQFTYYLLLNPNDRAGAALYTAGQLQGLLLSVMNELPYRTYTDTITQLKG